MRLAPTSPREQLLRPPTASSHERRKRSRQPIEVGLVARDTVEAVRGLQADDELVVPTDPGAGPIDSRRISKR